MEQSSVCERCRTWEEEMYWKHFSSMHFFLFLPKDFHHHLVLPAKFAENMMGKLPNKVPLIGPSAAMWDIELNKTNEVELGGDGWKEFVKTYNLKENNLLMFKYNQNLSFEVLIFDQESFCEKEVSYFVKQCRHEKAVHENAKKRTITEAFSMEIAEDEDEHDEDHDDPEFVVSKNSKNGVAEGPGRRNNPRTPRKAMLTRTPGGGGRPKKMMAVPTESQSKSKAQCENEPQENRAVLDVVEQEPEENGAAMEQSPVLEKEQNTLDNEGSIVRTAHSHKSTGNKGRPKRKVPTRSPRKVVFQSDSAEKYSKEYKSNRRPVTETEKENALKRGLQQLPENGFLAVLRPSAVYKRFYLNIPAGWMNEHLLHRNRHVVLRMEEKTWLVYFYHSGKGWGGFTSGWKKFVLDNSLEESDACLFKLATPKDDPEIIMDVEIFRVIPEIAPASPVGRSTVN